LLVPIFCGPIYKEILTDILNKFQFKQTHFRYPFSPYTETNSGGTVHKEIPALPENTSVNYEFSNRKRFYSVFSAICRGPIHNISSYFRSPYPWSTNLPAENGLNVACIRYFLSLFCSLYKLWCAISEQRKTRIHRVNNRYNIG